MERFGKLGKNVGLTLSPEAEKLVSSTVKQGYKWRKIYRYPRCMAVKMRWPCFFGTGNHERSGPDFIDDKEEHSGAI